MTTKKIVAVVVGLATASMMFAAVAVPAPAQAQTSAELQTQIQALLAQIAALQAQMSGGVSTPASMMFTSNLTIGSSGAEVTALQNFLIGKGHVIPAGATGYFGAQTKAALAAYQAANGIAPAVGYFGPMTRANVNAATPAVPGTPGTPATPAVPGNLEGDAGSVEEYELVSGINNEKVGEDEEDSTLMDFIEDIRSIPPDRAAAQQLLREYVRESIKDLSPREQKILEMRCVQRYTLWRGRP